MAGKFTVGSKDIPRLTVAGLRELIRLESKKKELKSAGRTLPLEETVLLSRLTTARRFTNLNTMKKKQAPVRRKPLRRKP